MTKQRTAILDCFKEHARPLGVEEILTLSSEQVPDINLSTIYRNLRGLIEDNQIIAVDVPGKGIRYEKPQKKHHHHFLCEQCDKLYDIPGCPKGLIDLVPSGFKLHSHSITLSGLCGSCTNG